MKKIKIGSDIIVYSLHASGIWGGTYFPNQEEAEQFYAN